MSDTRKIAAILAADVVGYSRLAGADEDRTLARLRALRSDLIDPTIAVHNGRVVKRTGDGILIEFRSVVDAVRCAIEIQNAMVERNAGVAEDRRIEFRVGIHLGDVVEESDGDLMGDGVNIAARLEGIAEPGAICLSEDAYRQVSGRLEMEVTDLGTTQLKNIDRQIRAYSLQAGVPAKPKPTKPAEPVTPAAPTPQKRRFRFAPLAAALAALLVLIACAWWFLNANRQVKVEDHSPATTQAAHLSIVVLPFANLSGDATQDYFADGITESLTTDLSRLSNSLVIARNTAFTFKGKNIDAKEIGKELGVRYVLEGSVQRDPQRIRVNVQLIDAETGNHIWAERFDKPLADLLDMQDEIVARVGNQLGTQLIAAEARRAEKAPNPDSMDLYFQGMALVNKGITRELFEKARDLFARALALDPGNVDAMVGLARADAIEAVAYLVDDRAAHFAAAEAMLTKALSLAPNNASAHQWMATVMNGTNRAAQAAVESDRALALDPNLAIAFVDKANSLIFTGRAEDAEAQVNQALRLSPRDNFAFIWMLEAGAAKIHLGADEEAVVWLRRSIDANPNLPFGHLFLAAALANLGRLDEARTQAQAGLALNPGFTLRQWVLGAESDNPTFLAQRERLTDGMRKAGVPEG
jgi:TolB-like protein/class 3 adenylate cyclase